MKMNYWLALGVMVAVTATAQDSTNLPALPAIPPPANAPASTPEVAPAPEMASVATTNAPASAKKKKHKKASTKAAPKKPAFTEPTVALVPGPASVCVSNLNVRGQAGLKGEVVGHLQKDDAVNIIAEITLDKHKADEPSQWAKISLPGNGGVWVLTRYIDASTKTVGVKKLNLRGGPGENYSVLGVIERGTPINENEVKGDWTRIDVPTNAYAFVAAMYLSQAASGTMPTNLPPSTETAAVPPPTPVAVTEGQQISSTAATPDMTSTSSGGNGVGNGATSPDVVPPPTPQVITETNIVTIVDTNVPPPPPRIVTHEGFVRASVSPVAPTYFELYDPSTGVAINYLFSPTTNLDLSLYKGLHINVTGKEGLDERWKDTPVLSVQQIYVLSTNAPALNADAKAKEKKPWYHLW